MPKKPRVERRGCLVCKAPYDQTDWPTVKVNGKVYPQSRCPECHKKLGEDYYYENQERIRLLKKAKRNGDQAAIQKYSRRLPKEPTILADPLQVLTILQL
jgi:hypothetical protein